MIDLPTLDGFVPLTYFLMETVLSVLGSVHQRDVLFSIDFKDTYFQIPIHLESRTYLQFALSGTVY